MKKQYIQPLAERMTIFASCMMTTATTGAYDDDPIVEEEEFLVHEREDALIEENENREWGDGLW